MPTYTFFNEQSGIEYDEQMSISEYEKFMENNPHIKRVWNSAPAMVGDHVMGAGPKTDSGFNDVMSNIGKSIAQNKAKRVIDKHAKRTK